MLTDAMLLIGAFVTLLIALHVSSRPKPSSRVLDLTPLVGKRKRW